MKIEIKIEDLDQLIVIDTIEKSFTSKSIQASRKVEKMENFAVIDKIIAKATPKISKVTGKPKRTWTRKVKEVDAPASSAGNTFRCEDCDDHFVSVLDLIDVACPDCNGVHIKKVE